MAKAKKPNNTALITNKTARRDYDIRKTYIAGIMLSSAEAKSLLTGHGQQRTYQLNSKIDLWNQNKLIKIYILSKKSAVQIFIHGVGNNSIGAGLSLNPGLWNTVKQEIQIQQL